MHFHSLLLVGLLLTCIQKLNAQNKKWVELDSLFESHIENKPDLAMSDVKEMEKIWRYSQNDSLKYEWMQRKAECFLLLDQFDEAMQLRYTLLTYFEKNRNDKRAVSIMLDLGNQYFQMKDYRRGLEILDKALKLSVKNNDKVDMVKINLEKGLHLAGLGRSEEGIMLMKENLTEARKILSEEEWIIGLDNLSNIYHEIKDYKKALQYQLEIYQSPFAKTANGHYKTGINQHLAEMYIELGELEQGQFHLDSAFYYGLKVGSKDWLYECYKNQYEIDLAKGHYQSALANHEKYSALKDSVYQEAYQSKMSAMANLYDLEHKQSKIKSLENETYVSNAKIKSLYMTVIILALLILLAWFYHLYKRKKEAEAAQKIFSTMLLQNQEEERQRIAKELHDSIGQNVLFIKNKIKKIFNNQEQDLANSVDNILNNVRSISKNLYPNELERYGLENAIDILAKQVMQEFDIFVSCDLTGLDQKTSKHNKINLYRIVQEFINNSIKHAEGKAIRITSQIMDSGIQLILQDNGIGFDLSKVHQNAYKSFGLVNIEERIKLMNGQLLYDTGIGKGTKFIINLPFS